jgi:capsular polysaccharide transport system permease protein
MLQRLARRNEGRSVTARTRAAAVLQPVIDVGAGARIHMGLFGWSFVGCVLLPSLIAFVYFCFIASHEYVSEAKFTIRTASQNESGLITDTNSLAASMNMGIGSRTTSQDVYIVADYIRSRSIIQDLGGKSVLSKLYSQPDIDWLSRLRPSSSLEKAWKYWKRKVTPLVDTPSGVITLEVRAYTPTEAHQLAQSILQKSEALVNEISERSRHDALTRAADEVKRAEERLRHAQLALLNFRNESRSINPSLSAQSISDTLQKLLQQKIELESNRDTLRRSVNENAPTMRVLTAQIDSLDKQILALKNSLTGRDNGNVVSAQLATYENLQLEAQFSDKLYSIAQASYEKARQEQEKQQLYLVTIDRPSEPQEATYPKIFVFSATTLAGCFILWSMIALMVATVKDHMGG